ncbi:162_t:CDS:2 [Scutellospora calospora]|uniref:162_t:CDS:1 n=1 Tax=Scutellospora calospora TaxID=85575 RepID=A0ACA9KYS3_9GLOM|nr:162_t:CDS:2 [Scutellospora calospora]
MKNNSKRQINKELKTQEPDQKKSRNLKPSSLWLKEWEWLDYCKIDGTLLMFCKWCKEAKHDNIFTRETSIYKRDIQFAPLSIKQLSENDLKVIYQMKCVYFAAKKHLSFNIYPDLCDLIISHNTISLISQLLKFSSQELVETRNYGTYLNSTVARNFAEAIMHVIETNLINEICLSGNWSIIIDESTSIDEKHLVIASHHLASNIPIVRYLGLINLEDCRAESIIKELELFIAKKNLHIKNIAHFCSDGASIMTVHRLHLADQDAAKTVPYFKEYESICKSLYNYFSSSYKRMLNLRMIQETNNDPQLNLLNIINTQWLSMSNAVKNLHQILDSVKDALNNDIITVENKQDQKKAKELLNNLDPNFILITKFLTDLMFILTKLINLFQQDYITISNIWFNLEITISAIKIQFIGNKNTKPTYGTFLHEYIDKNSIDLAQIPSSIMEFAKAIIQSLKSCFPNISLYNAMKIFEPNLLL